MDSNHPEQNSSKVVAPAFVSEEFFEGIQVKTFKCEFFFIAKRNREALRNADLVGASDPQCIVRVILLNGEAGPRSRDDDTGLYSRQ